MNKSAKAFFWFSTWLVPSVPVVHVLTSSLALEGVDWDTKGTLGHLGRCVRQD